MKGRKPKAAALKLLDGERPDRMPTPAPAPKPAVAPSPPDHLDALAAGKWAELAPDLADAGLLGSHGAEVLALYCEAHSRWRLACDELRAAGPVLNTDLGGCKANPAAAIARDAARQMASILADWERRRSAMAAVAAPRDELADFLSRKRG